MPCLQKNITSKERLQLISKDISKIESFKLHTQQKQRAVVGRVILFSVLLIILAASALYFWALPDRTIEKILYLAPFLLSPFLIVFLKRIINWYYARQITHNEIKLMRLKDEKKKLLEQVMDTETYKNAKEILEQFAPEQLRKENLQQQQQQSVAPKMTPQTQALARTSANTLQSAQLLNQELRRRTMTPLPPQIAGQPLAQPQPQQMPYPALPQRPQMARPILPRERGVMDKIVEFIVGDGPGNRFALICKQCASHNGMALQEEFEYLAFRCCYCFSWNPARKQRPPAPLLCLPSAPSELEGESSPSSDSEQEEGPTDKPDEEGTGEEVEEQALNEGEQVEQSKEETAEQSEPLLNKVESSEVQESEAIVEKEADEAA
ncbi:Hypothetical predicted protein [Cloeon dipterum]|uniref:Endoplasmic reticulum junction formation protein lunapark n=1 Tax=Cloeon dipterum TaxID=197152 RepID=A0A8S1D4S0_9INSE|nr:Hypothetical predicted protein [Cloeon dipterum]